MQPEIKIENGRIDDAVAERALALANKSERDDQRAVYDWLAKNTRLVSEDFWNRHYGYLLHRLHCASPVSSLVALIIAITSKKTLSQGRVNMVASLYAQNLNPALSHLLCAMRSFAGDCPIYIASTGQENVLAAKLPPKVAYKLCKGDTVELSRANTDIKLQLGNDAVETLVGLAPVVSISGKVPLAVEEYVYDYFECWDGELSPLLMAIVPLFKFWPNHSVPVIRAKIVNHLLRAKQQAMSIILPELWWLGRVAEQVIVKFEPKLGPSQYTHLVQFYQSLDLEPPPQIVRHIIYYLPGGLALCRDWARSVPDICSVLQGQLYFPTHLIQENQYVLANCPWIGTFSTELFKKRFNFSPVSIYPELYDKLAMDYESFCSELVNVMSQQGYNVEPYLAYVQN